MHAQVQSQSILRLLKNRLLRGVLFYSTGGLCAQCGDHLTEAWHADHVIPFKVDPTTNVHRMQPLCPKCNLTKGGKILSQMTDILRPWQQEFVRLCDTISETNRKIIVRAVPASGKGSVPYLLLGHAPRSEVLYACHVVPRINLKTQSETPPRWLLDYLERSGIRTPTIRASSNITPFRRQSDGYSICWDSIRGGASDLHKQEFENAGKYALIIDEPQMIPQDGSTVRALLPLVELCSCLIMMSGTFERGDGGRIPFLPYRNTEDGEVVDYEASGWRTVRYSRREALRDEAILPIEFVLRDARGQFIKGGETFEFSSLSSLETEYDQRSGLFAVISDKGGLDIACEMIESWKSFRKITPLSQSLIITHSQKSARDYKSEILKICPNAKIKIAISDEPGSSEVLKKFRDGDGDVLITVGMAYVGFDAPRISHIALLTYIRQSTWIEQAVARGARVFDQYPYSIQRCVVYAPNDPLLVDIVKKIEEEQEAALLDKKGTTGGGGGGERDETIVINIELTNTQSHELNKVKLTPELTERYIHSIVNNGLTGTPAQFFQAINDVFGASPMVFVTTAPIIGISEQEDKLKKIIESRCRRTDAIRGVDWGTTNSEIMKFFNLSRTQMSLEQLLEALKWLDREHPLKNENSERSENSIA